MYALLFAATFATQSPPPGASPDPLPLVRAAFERLDRYPVAPFVVFYGAWHVRSIPLDTVDASQSRTSEVVARYAWRASDGTENWSDTAPHKGLPAASIVPQFLGPFAWSLRTTYPASNPHTDIEPDISGLRTIAVVHAVAKPVYTIRLSGIETIDGHVCFHIVLTPLVDAERHNLRDLWIDARTDDLWQARFTGRYDDHRTTVTASLQTVGPFRVVDQARWTYRDLQASHHCRLRLLHLVFLSKLPQWIFDARAYEAHRRAGVPDLIGRILQTTTATPSASP